MQRRCAETHGEFVMNKSSKILSGALMTAATLWIVAPAAAAPISSPLGLQNAVAPPIETVRYRGGRRGHYRGGRYGGVGLGLVAGAIISGAIIAAQQPYGYYGPGYGPGYITDSPYAGNEVGYCQQRFRSYDLNSGTYLGFDGLRHSCP
jgi:BA14K-like protein